MFKKLNKNNPLPNLIRDNNLICSQSMCRSDLNTSTSKVEETNGLSEMRNISQLAHNSSVLTESRSIFLSDHEIGEKIENFIFHTNTPRQLIKSQLTLTQPK